MINAPVQPEQIEPADLIRRVSQLRAALEAAARDDAHLQRELASARIENHRLHEQLESHPNQRARQERRRMISESWSRNP